MRIRKEGLIFLLGVMVAYGHSFVRVITQMTLDFLQHCGMEVTSKLLRDVCRDKIS